MDNIITGWEFAALLVMVGLLFAFLEMMNVREEINRLRDVRQEDKEQAEEDEREHRRMVREADSYNEACNAVNTDEYKRWLNARIGNQHAASMEPFCGEGKKP